MIGVTERAKQELKRILSAKVDNPQAGLRFISSGPDQFGLSIDIEMPGDQVVQHEGSKVLLVEHELATRLEGHILDFEDTPDGKNFVLVERELRNRSK